jgi:hypothetical protein
MRLGYKQKNAGEQKTSMSQSSGGFVTAYFSGFSPFARLFDRISSTSM